MSPSQRAVCTIVARNYLAYALTLLKSVERNCLHTTRYVLVVDGFDRDHDPELARCGIIATSPLEFLPYEVAAGLAYSYDITEYSTALKPFFLKYLLDRGHSSVLYMDPDIMVFDSLQAEVWNPLADASIVLTPHTTDPIPLDGCVPNEITLLRAGAYNLGFIGVRETHEARRFLAWWSDRLERYCVNRVEAGLFVDQKWIDLVPGMFAGARVLRHRGLNVAYWNLHARRLTRAFDGGTILAGGEPLLFFHFSGFDSTKPTELSRHQDRVDTAREPVLCELLAQYAAELSAWSHEERRRVPYRHATFANGARVDPYVRAVCRDAREQGLSFPDPRDPDALPSLIDYCNSTAPDDNGVIPRLTRYSVMMHAMRPDLRATFPDLYGADRGRYLHWMHSSQSEPIDKSFLGATLETPRERSRGLPLVNVAGYFRAESGVGEAGRAHVSAVRAAGYDVHLLDLSASAVYSRHREAVAHSRREVGAVNLICVNADQVPHFAETGGDKILAGRYNIGSWWWELPSFPARWISNFEPFDEIWVGSEYVRETLRQATSLPIVRVPPVVSPPPVRDPSKERFGFAPDAFTFVYFFDYLSIFERKNPLAALMAFECAFPFRRDVRLVFKSINAHMDPENAAAFEAACAADPRVEVRQAYLGRDEKNAMIAAADCYVSLHRAEGFGLTIAEAMYYGTPVICTGWSGNMDFTNDSNAFIVDAPVVPLERDYGPYTAGDSWADPDIEQAVRAMQSVVNDPLDAYSRARRAGYEMRKNFSALTVGAIARDRLSRVLELHGDYV